ncbi:unnamed protein product [Rhizoctonia solani]|uniref:MYND-type domain-containing protein n=1 Tax=Rhizoctonia solani TaxID=456999 RepID=A0A8H3HC30_9AGAM|nr:unnamed protein product [Rhizoctonia solani]
MSTLSHPLWGRAIGYYPYAPDVNRASLPVDCELNGLQAMEKIALLSNEASTRAQTDATPHIDIHTLQSALLLSVDPTTIGHLANPAVINACVRLMKTVGGRPGAPSPFSYEYGYLSFMLLVSCLNICLLERWDDLDAARTGCAQRPDATAQIVTSNMLASQVLTQFDVVRDGGDCDWVLGWSTSHLHRRQSPLISQSDISFLLNILWDDRKFFLRSQSLTQYIHGSVGLSGLTYILVAGKYQRDATLRVIEEVPSDSRWSSTPKHVDLEDSRLIMTSFIKQLSNEDDPDILVKQDATMMLRFVPLAVDTNSQDLLPEVWKWTIQYGWSVLLEFNESPQVESFMQMAFAGLSWLISPPLNRPCRLTPSTRSQIMDTIYEGELLDWTAYAMTRLDPAQLLREASLTSILVFFDNLARVVSKNALAHRFRDYVPNWHKFASHLVITMNGLGAVTSLKHKKYYERCVVTWRKVGSIFGLEQIKDYEAKAPKCSSTRCAHARLNVGAIFGCADCAHVMYCDKRCQVVDWKFGDHCSAHGKLSHPSLPVLR